MILELRNLSNKNMRKRAMKIDCSYFYYSNMIKKFEEARLVTVEKKGRECFVHLTGKGRDLADKLRFIMDQLRSFAKKIPRAEKSVL